MMIPISLVLVFASVVLVVVSCAPDNAQRLIRARILTEVGEVQTVRGAQFPRWLSKVGAFNYFLPAQLISQRSSQDLELGKVGINVIEFLTLKEFTAVAAFVLYMVMTSAGHDRPNPMMMVMAPVMGFFLPDLWLKQRITARKDEIAREMPEVVDLLHLCVEAGVDFMGGLTRVVHESPKGLLINELSVVISEIRVGKPRREALRALAKRVRVPDVASFVRTMVQADRMGTGIGEALRILSEESRLRRYHRAERFAQKAPIKMLLPLMMIMLTVLIVVGGPIMLQFLHGSVFPKSF